MALPLQESLRQSELVFRATVEKTGASTMPEVPASDRTLVVLVTQVLRSPEVLRLLAGRSITVLATDTALRPGQDVVFFATGWLYGQSLAVIEISRQTAAAEFASLPQQLAADAQAASDQALTDRLRGAALVVSGRVAQTTAIPVPPLTESEHTPYWTEAMVEVASVEKGTPPGPTVPVLYAASHDIMWNHAPKLQVAQEGVFILRSGPVDGLDRVAFTALDPLDVHPTAALARVRRLIPAGG